ncbi:MAG TPA: 23S rRNA (pseudouridine(1915)-N(3))-methyltransferase RlmH [Burkholderiales bacterium]|nr:23S rRNA (pseudouridine(1915)-N(3))-methyltransferase RlmH [Burkholderiales bacterium]
MKFVVAAVGHRMPAWIQAGFDEYARRMPRDAQLAVKEIKPAPRRKDLGAMAVRRLLQTEHQRIIAALPANCYKVVLDERGAAWTTRQLAERIARWREFGRDVGFIIGGADGTAAALKEEADLLWSVSPLTLPHGLVRIVLAEQLYRAVSLLSGHPYHRE